MVEAEHQGRGEGEAEEPGEQRRERALRPLGEGRLRLSSNRSSGSPQQGAALREGTTVRRARKVRAEPTSRGSSSSLSTGAVCSTIALSRATQTDGHRPHQFRAFRRAVASPSVAQGPPQPGKPRLALSTLQLSSSHMRTQDTRRKGENRCWLRVRYTERPGRRSGGQRGGRGRLARLLLALLLLEEFPASREKSQRLSWKVAATGERNAEQDSTVEGEGEERRTHRLASSTSFSFLARKFCSLCDASGDHPAPLSGEPSASLPLPATLPCSWSSAATLAWRPMRLMSDGGGPCATCAEVDEPRAGVTGVGVAGRATAGTEPSDGGGK